MKRADRLDYRILHKYGIRVIKMDDVKVDEARAKDPDNLEHEYEGNPNLDNLVLAEKKLSADLRNDFLLYDPKDLITDEEFNEAIETIKDGGQKYRHIHVELQNLLGDQHKEKYPKYEDNVKKIMTFIKSLRKKLREVKKSQVDTKMASDDQNDQRVKVHTILVEEDVLNLKISTLNNSLDLKLAGEIREVDSYITKMEEYTSQYLDLLGKLKLCCNEEEFSIHAKRVDANALEITQDLKNC